MEIQRPDLKTKASSAQELKRALNALNSYDTVQLLLSLKKREKAACKTKPPETTGAYKRELSLNTFTGISDFLDCPERDYSAQCHADSGQFFVIFCPGRDQTSRVEGFWREIWRNDTRTAQLVFYVFSLILLTGAKTKRQDARRVENTNVVGIGELSVRTFCIFLRE